MSSFNRINYPLAPSGAPRAGSANRRHVQGVITSHGRGAVATPQALITMQAIVEKRERQRRSVMARAGDLSSVYAPPSLDDSDFSVKKGMLGLCRLDNDSSFRGALTNDSNVHVVSNMAGLSRDEPLGMPCVIQVARDADDINSDNRTTIVAQGVQTIVNTGCQHIAPGQPLYVDPNPFMIEDPDQPGNMISGINIIGINNAVKHPQVRPMDTNNVHSMILSMKDYMRKVMGSSSFKDSLSHARDGDSLSKLFDTECEKMFRVKNLSIDMPIRGLLRIWSPYFYLQQLNMQATSLTNDLSSYTLALLALCKSLQTSETSFVRIFRAYDASLPHDTIDTKPSFYRASVNPYSLHSTTLTDLLSVQKLNDLGSLDAQCIQLHKAEAHLNEHFHYYSDVYREAQRNYMQKFMLGVSLSSAALGKPVDVLIGGH